MTDGNDWGNQPGGDWENQPAQPQGNPAAGAVPATQNQHPLGNGQFDFGAFIDVTKLVFNRIKDGPILKLIIGLTAVWLLIDLFGGLLMSVTHFVPGAGMVLGILIMIMTILLYPVYLLAMAVVYSLYKPTAQQVFHGPSHLGSPIELMKSTFGNLIQVFVTMLLLGVTIGVGVLCCVIPGIIAGVLFGQAPYLVATRDQGIIESFQLSFERAKRHWNVLAIMFIIWIAVVVGAVLFTVITSLVLGVISSFFAPIGYLGQPVISWIFSAVTLVIYFLVSSAAFTTIDELEGLDTIQR